MEEIKRLFELLKEGDAIEYIRKNGFNDFIVLRGEVILKDELEFYTAKNGHFGICEDYNNAMYVYFKQNNGDYKRFTIHENNAK